MERYISILSILSLLSIIPLHSFPFLLPITPLFCFLSLLLFLPFFSSYLSFPCSPSSLPLPHFFPLPASPYPLFSNHFFPPYPSIFPTFHSFLPLLSLLASFPSSPSVMCYLCFYSYPSFTSTIRFPFHIPFLPFLSVLIHLSILLSSHSPSFHRIPSLSSSNLFLPTSIPPSLSPFLSLFSFLSLSPSISPYRTLSSSLLQFLPFFLLSFFSILPHPYTHPSSFSHSYVSFSLSPIIVLCSIHNTVIYNST